MLSETVSIHLRRDIINSRVKHKRLHSVIKRFIDIIVSLFVLLFLFPMFLFISIYIRIKSPGAVIFKQIRMRENRRKSVNRRKPVNGSFTDRDFNDFNVETVSKLPGRYKNEFGNIIAEKIRTDNGTDHSCMNDVGGEFDRREHNLYGRTFKIYKFRTMFTDAKERFPELYSYKYDSREINDLVFKCKDDPRVPKWAEWLRKSSLDELPNFINVLLGDMSLVGPRPDIPEMINYYTDEQRLKLKVKPGITGLAQIQGRANLLFQETLKYDVEYVKKMPSLMLDFRIIFKTIVATITGHGAH